MSGLSFELATAGRIVFRAGAVLETAAAVGGLGARRTLVVTGRSRGRAAPLFEQLEAAGIACTSFSVDREPTVEVARAGTALAVREGCEAVIACGGGSAIDAGKAIAALATNGGDPMEHLEVIGRGRPLGRPGLPFIAIPTTAGTGSEVTRNAVLCDTASRVKVSLRSPLMLARVALVDPELLGGLPPAVMASSGLDALSQLIEPLLSARAQPLSDALSRDGIRRSARSLRRAVLDGADAAAREDLALASLFGGLCLANAGLGAVHGFAAPLGGSFDAPHGAVCAALLPVVLEINLRALRARAPASPVIARFEELGPLLTGSPGAGATEAIAWVRNLCRDLSIPGLARHGMSAADVPEVVAKARGASSMKGNPIALHDDELAEIALRSL